MSLQTRVASARAERDQLVNFLQSHLNPAADVARFDWLYLRNPDGEARVWVTEREGDVLGVAAAFPRRLLWNRERVLGCVFGDFCIAPKYRSLGPALQLQRACLKAVDQAEFAAAYDLPSASMLAVYKRLGLHCHQSLVRLVKPLRLDRKIAEKTDRPWLAHGLRTAGNLALALRDHALPRPPAGSISLQDKKCGEEFDLLGGGTRPVECEWQVERSARYLNWRYFEHPHRCYTMLTVRRDTKLQGYIIFTRSGDEATISDLHAPREPKVFSGLIGTAVEMLRHEGVMNLNAPILTGHSLILRLRKLGFRERESSPMLSYCGSQPIATGPRHCCAAFMTDGDRES